MHQSSPAEVPQHQADYKAKPTGCYAGNMMQQFPLAPTLAHILQEQGPSQ